MRNAFIWKVQKHHKKAIITIINEMMKHSTNLYTSELPKMKISNMEETCKLTFTDLSNTFFMNDTSQIDVRALRNEK